MNRLIFFLLSIVIRIADGALLVYPTDRNATIGQAIIMPCVTDLDLPVYWYFNNHEIFYGGKVSMSFQAMFKVSTEKKGEYNLSISSADASYNGEYICGDDEGQGERKSALLYVTAVAESVETTNGPNGHANIGAIIGIVAAAGILVLFLAILIPVCVYKKRCNSSPKSDTRKDSIGNEHPTRGVAIQGSGASEASNRNVLQPSNVLDCGVLESSNSNVISSPNVLGSGASEASNRNVLQPSNVLDCGVLESSNSNVISSPNVLVSDAKKFYDEMATEQQKENNYSTTKKMSKTKKSMATKNFGDTKLHETEPLLSCNTDVTAETLPAVGDSEPQSDNAYQSAEGNSKKSLQLTKSSSIKDENLTCIVNSTPGPKPARDVYLTRDYPLKPSADKPNTDLDAEPQSDKAAEGNPHRTSLSTLETPLTSSHIGHEPELTNEQEPTAVAMTDAKSKDGSQADVVPSSTITDGKCTFMAKPVPGPKPVIDVHSPGAGKLRPTPSVASEPTAHPRTRLEATKDQQSATLESADAQPHLVPQEAAGEQQANNK